MPVDVVKEAAERAARPCVSLLQSNNLTNTRQINKFLRSGGAKVYPSSGTFLAMNLILHAFVVFLALSFLFTVILGPESSSRLQSELNNRVPVIVGNILETLDPSTEKQVQEGLASAKPLLMRLQQKYSQPDTLQNQTNSDVYATAWGVTSIVGGIFAIVWGILAAFKLNISAYIKNMFATNAIIFVVVGIVEVSFFNSVAPAWDPILPSEAAQITLQTLEQQFPAPAPAPLPYNP